jgi:hypothetical protein
MAYNSGLVVRHKRVKHTVSGRNPEEAAVPIEVAHKEAAEAVRVVHSTEEVAVPIAVVHKAIEVADRVVAVARKAVEVADSALAAVVDLDHKT